MCHIFSGHISYATETWGEVYFGPTYIHHEEDRISMPYELLLAWETEEEASFAGGFKFTHDCGGNVPQATKDKLMEVLVEWGRQQQPHTQEYLEYIVITSPEKWPIRDIATRYITDQDTLTQIAANDEHWHVRKTATEHITNQETLAKIATTDDSWHVRIRQLKAKETHNE